MANDKYSFLPALAAAFALVVAVSCKDSSSSDPPSSSSSSSSGGSSSGASSSGATSSSGTASSSGGSSGTATGTLDSAESAVFVDGMTSLIIVTQATMLADDFFDFETGTLDPTRDAPDNVGPILANIGSHTTCGTVEQTSDIGIHADFSAGCTFDDAMKITSTLNVAVSKIGNEASATLSFLGETTINGRALGGGPQFKTTDGKTFTLGGSLGPDTSTSIGALDGVTMSASGDVFSAEGTMASVKMANDTNMTLTGIKWKRGDCYPSAGTMKVSRDAISLTIAFAATTPATGHADVTVGSKTADGAMPEYGSCKPM